jgi:hypothetical protein
MRNLKTGLITLAATAAFLVPAAGAQAATTSSVATTNASMTASGSCLFLCFDIYKNGVLTDIDVDLITATLKCIGVNLQALNIGQQAICGDPTVTVVRKK